MRSECDRHSDSFVPTRLCQSQRVDGWSVKWLNPFTAPTPDTETSSGLSACVCDSVPELAVAAGEPINIFHNVSAPVECSLRLWWWSLAANIIVAPALLSQFPICWDDAGCLRPGSSPELRSNNRSNFVQYSYVASQGIAATTSLLWSEVTWDCLFHLSLIKSVRTVRSQGHLSYPACSF